jgi:hypothetical protein
VKFSLRLVKTKEQDLLFIDITSNCSYRKDEGCVGTYPMGPYPFGIPASTGVLRVSEAFQF